MIKLTLCQMGCCPTVEVVNNNVVIKDDFGGTVSLTKEQLKILLDKYQEILGEK